MRGAETVRVPGGNREGDHPSAYSSGPDKKRVAALMGPRCGRSQDEAIGYVHKLAAQNEAVGPGCHTDSCGLHCVEAAKGTATLLRRLQDAAFGASSCVSSPFSLCAPSCASFSGFGARRRRLPMCRPCHQIQKPVVAVLISHKVRARLLCLARTGGAARRMASQEATVNKRKWLPSCSRWPRGRVHRVHTHPMDPKCNAATADRSRPRFGHRPAARAEETRLAAVALWGRIDQRPGYAALPLERTCGFFMPH